MLADIAKYTDLYCGIGTGKSSTLRSCIPAIAFGDKPLTQFVVEWVETLNLYNQNIIGDDIYSLWINQQLDTYKKIKLPKKKPRAKIAMVGRNFIADNEPESKEDL